jgi:uncharacterized protein HemX
MIIPSAMKIALAAAAALGTAGVAVVGSQSSQDSAENTVQVAQAPSHGYEKIAQELTPLMCRQGCDPSRLFNGR